MNNNLAYKTQEDSFVLLCAFEKLVPSMLDGLAAGVYIIATNRISQLIQLQIAPQLQRVKLRS